MSIDAVERPTVTPDPSQHAQLQALRDFLDAVPTGEGREAPDLMSPSGRRQEAPYEVFGLLPEMGLLWVWLSPDL